MNAFYWYTKLTRKMKFKKTKDVQNINLMFSSLDLKNIKILGYKIFEF